MSIETDVLQTVQALPGDNVEMKPISIITLRWLHDQNLTLWDDIKMYQSSHFSV